MRYSEEEVQAFILDTNGIHHLPRAAFAEIMRQRPYEEVRGKKLIFIDMKYWISFRIVLDNETTSMAQEQKILYKNIYHQLIQLTEKAEVACVVSDSILTEIEKMPLEKKLKTASLMDKLKITVILNGLNACSLEFINIDRISVGKQPIENYHLSSVYEANRFLTAMTFKKLEDEPNLLFNLLYDSISGMTVEEYLKETDGDFYDASEQFAQIMNDTKQIDTSPHNYKGLLIQGLKSQIEPLKNILKHSPIGQIDPVKHLPLYRTHAPFLYLHSAIHAAINIEISRKVHKNDFYDLSHSCIGVGYADYFFTEKKFHHLLKSKPIDCTSYYKCEIYSEPLEIMNLLKQLNNN
ncbi:hypothetical protein EZ428_21295 [Pedobacter frigiditerrae]|uniref:Uncharacterized protein n=1 Tax=Pedobacter frigiditerrae TaxID=2530452 RepID=A0A4R0MMP3_9SPHI|nr:hypothetical protein [Pedobacter frigiditerrae]TCC87244.1 hypothetical protein EZ428_21295 [Pedobacter frigiditerrae]